MSEIKQTFRHVFSKREIEGIHGILHKCAEEQPLMDKKLIVDFIKSMKKNTIKSLVTIYSIHGLMAGIDASSYEHNEVH
jgi:hypothetical protein